MTREDAEQQSEHWQDIIDEKDALIEQQATEMAFHVSRVDALRRFLSEKIAECQNQAKEIAKLRERKDGAYLERNKVVAALAKCFPSGVARTAIEGWHEEWHGCVYIDLPTGQVSWHYHDSHASLFEDLPAYSGTWDGHSTEEKYARLAALKEEQS